jgi:uncharacterized membrane protein (UPF0127 family)
MKKLFIELADTPSKREYGLMNRKYLPKNQGMLFKFPNPTLASFWMKNTYIPLDIAFLDDHGSVLQIESMSPLNTKAIYSNRSCRYALEVNKGWFAENGITVGSRVGGEGIRGHKITAQINLPPSSGAVPGVLEAIPSQPPTGEPAHQPAPDVTLNLTYKERLRKGEAKKQDFIIIYQTKDGRTLPPKVISPPFTFEQDEHGHHDAVVKAWDNQTGGWKSFLIDNILSLEDKK